MISSELSKLINIVKGAENDGSGVAHRKSYRGYRYISSHVIENKDRDMESFKVTACKTRAEI